MSVGIDVGSTMFRMAHFGSRPELVSGGSPPAVVAVGAERLLVGRDARRELDTKHDNVYRFPVSRIVLTEPTLLLHPKGGEREMWPEAAAAALFAQLEQVCRRKGVQLLRHLTLSIPPCLTSLERKQLSVAAMAAGLPRPEYISCSVAATLQWSMGRKPNAPAATLLVIDSGSKFTSVSTIRVEGIKDGVSASVVSCRVFRYGGHAVDVRMMHLAPHQPTVHTRVIWGAVENSKKELSSLKDSEVRVKEKTTIINRGQLSSALAPLMGRVSRACRKITTELPKNMQLTNALIVGGSGRLTELQQFVKSEYGLQAEVADYDYSAALGSALWSGNRAGLCKRTVYQSATNNLTGHRYFAIRLDSDTGDPTDEVHELFTEGVMVAELRDLGKGTWAVLEHQRGSRGYLTPSELAAYLRRLKSPEYEYGSKVEVVVAKASNVAAIGAQFRDLQPDAESPPGASSVVVLGTVLPGSPADTANLHHYEGWMAISINGTAVVSSKQIEDIITPARACVLGLKKARREELPASAGDEEPWEAVFIGWTHGGPLRIDKNGIITGLSVPDEDMLTESELRDQLESDAQLNTNVEAYSESRNLLEAATLRMEEASIDPKDLKQICSNAPHYFDLADTLLKSDEVPYETDEIKKLSDLIDRMLDAVDDTSLTSTVSALELSLTPKMAPGCSGPAEGGGRNRSLTMGSFKKKTARRSATQLRVPTSSPDEHSHLQRARSAIKMVRRSVPSKDGDVHLSGGSMMTRKRSYRKGDPSSELKSPRNGALKGTRATPFRLSASTDSLKMRSPSPRPSKNPLAASHKNLLASSTKGNLNSSMKLNASTKGNSFSSTPRGDMLSPGPVKRKTKGSMSPARPSQSPKTSPRSSTLPGRPGPRNCLLSPTRSSLSPALQRKESTRRPSVSPAGSIRGSVSPARPQLPGFRKETNSSSQKRSQTQRAMSPPRSNSNSPPQRSLSQPRVANGVVPDSQPSPTGSSSSMSKSLLCIKGSFGGSMKGSVRGNSRSQSLDVENEADRMNRSFKAMTQNNPIPMLQVCDIDDEDLDDLLEVVSNGSDSQLGRSVSALNSLSPSSSEKRAPSVMFASASSLLSTSMLNGNAFANASRRTSSPSPRRGPTNTTHHSLLQRSSLEMFVSNLDTSSLSPKSQGSSSLSPKARSRSHSPKSRSHSPKAHTTPRSGSGNSLLSPSAETPSFSPGAPMRRSVEDMFEGAIPITVTTSVDSVQPRRDLDSILADNAIPITVTTSLESLPLRRMSTLEDVRSSSFDDVGNNGPSPRGRTCEHPQVGLSSTLGELFPIRSHTPPATRRWKMKASIDRVVSRAVKRAVEGSPPGAVEDPVEFATFLAQNAQNGTPRAAPSEPPPSLSQTHSQPHSRTFAAPRRRMASTSPPIAFASRPSFDMVMPGRRKSTSMTHPPARGQSPRTPVRTATPTRARTKSPSPTVDKRHSMRFNLPAYGNSGTHASPTGRALSSTFSSGMASRHHAMVVSSPQWEEIAGVEGIPCRWAPTHVEDSKRRADDPLKLRSKSPLAISRSKSPSSSSLASPIIVARASPRGSPRPFGKGSPRFREPQSPQFR